MKYLDTAKRGKFIVVYGPSNVGKSTQVSMLVSKLVTEYHTQVLLIKYPVYGLEPTGEEILKIVKPTSTKNYLVVNDIALQTLYAKNRLDFQNVVEVCLRAGIHVIAEDYIGTGLARGMTSGVSLKELLKINSLLLIPDMSILIDGKRFTNSIEKHHIFENAGNELWEKNRNIHLKLAKRFGWKIVKSDDSKETVHVNLWKLVNKELKLK